MRIFITLDDDVAALLERERQRTGEATRQLVSRLLRHALRDGVSTQRDVQLPLLAGRPRVDVVDVSAVLAAEEDEHRRAQVDPHAD